MSLTLAVDFGSTYTKVVAVDLAREELLAVVQAKTTAQTDVTIGLEAALRLLWDATGAGMSDVDGIVVDLHLKLTQDWLKSRQFLSGLHFGRAW